MEESIISTIATLIEVIFFALAYWIEKTKIKSTVEEETKEKAIKRIGNIFYIWTDLSVILSILVIESIVCVEWHMNLIAIYMAYYVINTVISIVKIKKDIFKGKYFLKKVLFLVGMILTFVLFFDRCDYYIHPPITDNTMDVLKPIIYIYPETETKVQVSVGYPEKLSCVYPEYDTEDGWEVIAKPNGDLVDTRTSRNLYCLYWEGNQKQEYRFKDGFVVAGEDSVKFLEEKLAILGLNEREANEFIIYWLPKLEANKYNLIRFETMEEIEAYMPLNIEPKPDSLIRISMNFKELNRPIEIEEQKLEPVVREGYTVVEWGGSEF